MGVTITHELVQRTKHVEKMLDRVQKYVEQLNENVIKKTTLSMTIRRIHTHALFIDFEDCETLAFEFNPLDRLDGFQLMSYNLLKICQDRNTNTSRHLASIGRTEEQIDGEMLLISRDWCKTQYGKSDLSHKFICDITRAIASQCVMSIIDDEADYYQSNYFQDIGMSKAENKKVIDSVVGKIKKAK